MQFSRRKFMGLAAGASIVPTLGRTGWAQVYPTKPARIVVGFAAGGNFDVVARLIGQSMAETLNQLFVVENRPGASGNIATEAVMQAPADGYTLLLCGAVNAINSTLYAKTKPAFADNIAPIGGAVRFPNVVTVNAALPVRSIPELVAYAKANPGGISYGSSGIGTTQHLAGELFRAMAGIEMTHVPYKGASAALTDLLGNHVQLLFEALPASMPHIRSGKIRALGATTSDRSVALPDVPAVGEHLPGYEASGWTGLCAPRNTPVEVIRKLNNALNAGLVDTVVRSRIADLGATPLAGSPEDFGLLISSETEKWARVITSADIRME